MKKIIEWIGRIITLLAFVYIIRIIIAFDVEFSRLLEVKIIVTMLMLAMLMSTCVVFNSVAWKKLIGLISDKRIALKDVLHIYAKSNIGKYLPGNVMHYANRNILGFQYSINQKHMAFSTIMEIVLKVICVFIMITIFASDQMNGVIDLLDNNYGIDIGYIYILLISGILVLSLVLYYLFRKRLKKPFRISVVFWTIILYAIVFIINVTVFIISALLISDHSIIMNNVLYIASIYLIAWLIGYLTPGSPGGIGVRETIAVLALGNILNQEEVALISVMARIVTITGDIIAYSVNMIYEKRRNIYETNHSNTVL